MEHRRATESLEARAAIRKLDGKTGRLQQTNLWIHYSARLRRDVMLCSDAHFDHFCWLEGDPQVHSYELAPSPQLIADDEEVEPMRVHALVRLRGSRPQLHDVFEEVPEHLPPDVKRLERFKTAVDAAGFDYVCITRGDLARREQLIVNWRRALPFLAACRDVVLQTRCNEISFIARAEGTQTLKEILAATDPVLEPIYVAAILSCLQQGWLCSDLDTKPLCLNTRVWRHKEDCHAI